MYNCRILCCCCQLTKAYLSVFLTGDQITLEQAFLKQNLLLHTLARGFTKIVKASADGRCDQQEPYPALNHFMVSAHGAQRIGLSHNRRKLERTKIEDQKLEILPDSGQILHRFRGHYRTRNSCSRSQNTDGAPVFPFPLAGKNALAAGRYARYHRQNIAFKALNSAVHQRDAALYAAFV